MQRFRCFHELAHVSDQGACIYPKAIYSRLLLCIEIVLFLFLIGLKPVHTSLLAIYAIVHFLKSGREVHTHEIEAKADAFAVTRLGNADKALGGILRRFRKAA